jgi:SAM-dependent methyltransferase
MTSAHDDPTIAFYNQEAAKYAARRAPERWPQLDAFINRLSPNAKVLELGTGGGQDASVMIAAGLDVTPTDASVGLATQAETLLGRPVRIMRFDELDAEAEFDGVWANMCLLHVPADALGDVLARIWRALKPGGIFFANYKAGDGGDRDALGRYYNFPTRDSLVRIYESAAAWSSCVITEAPGGGGYDGVMRTVLLCWTVK